MKKNPFLSDMYFRNNLNSLRIVTFIDDNISSYIHRLLFKCRIISCFCNENYILSRISKCSDTFDSVSEFHSLKWDFV